MSTLQERVEDSETTVTGEWALPTEREPFLEWLAEHGMTLAQFRALPAWKNAPQELVDSLAD